MPELPDVEGQKRYCNRYARGRRVSSVTVPSPEDLRNRSPAPFGRALADRRIRHADRHGKWLFVPVSDGPTVVLHFGMTGTLTWTERPDGLHDHDRVVFDLDGGRLTYRTQRRLGGVWLARDDEELAAVTGPLGPDASTLDRAGLADVLAGRRGGIKAALMDQELLAGVGNELSDEILWRSRIHPRTAVSELGDDDLDRLGDALETTVRSSMRRGRIPEEDGWLEVARGVDDPRCPRCGARVERVDAAGRTAYVCSAEQQLA